MWATKLFPRKNTAQWYYFSYKSKVKIPLVSRLVQPGEKKVSEGSLTAACLCLWGSYQEDGVRVFTVLHGGRMRHNGQWNDIHTGNKEQFFYYEVGRQVKRLPREVMQSPSLDVLKTSQDKALSNQFCSYTWPLLKQEAELETFWGPFWSGLSCDPKIL